MISVVLPTFNEAENIPELVPKVSKALAGVEHEIIIVDDNSPDRTWEVAREVALKVPNVSVIRRVGRKGLSSAVIEGFLAAKGDHLAVMDADGQHDLTLIPKLNQELQVGADMAIGSRYVEGGSVGEWDERRHLLSKIATRMAVGLCKVKVNDPMSGFFAVKRSVFENVLPKLNPKGFKILLDFLVHTKRTTKVKELPFTFALRTHGESKLSRRVQIEFLEYLYDVTVGRYIPLTFVKYCLVGALGAGVQVAAYAIIASFFRDGGLITLDNFRFSQYIAIEIAIIFNFLLNNVWTFAAVRLRGLRAIRGLLTFNAACVFGALANLAVAEYLLDRGVHEIAAVLFGAIIGAIWNYTMNRLITWKEE